VLHLKPDAKPISRRTSAHRRTYSDHVLFLSSWRAGRPRQINAASAITAPPEVEIKPEDYTQAYRTIAGAFASRP
jgi:molecular chaperone HtpG